MLYLWHRFDLKQQLCFQFYIGYNSFFFFFFFNGSPHKAYAYSYIHIQKFAKHQLLCIIPVQQLVTFHTDLKHIINRGFVYIPTYTFHVKDLDGEGINNGQQSTLLFSNNLNMIYMRMFVKNIGFMVQSDVCYGHHHIPGIPQYIEKLSSHVKSQLIKNPTFQPSCNTIV